MGITEFEVMKLCKNQLKDINPNDILHDGLYRKCNCYYDHTGKHRGGGYDKFPELWEKRKGYAIGADQFVVQLKGCPLKCHYCYVTPDGIAHGESTKVSADKLVTDFYGSKLDIFHLMGGAPASYINDWPYIVERLHDKTPFHSDLLLIEGEYDTSNLKKLAKYNNILLAMSIKGCNSQEFEQITRTKFDSTLFYDNLTKLLDSGIDFYTTFTGASNDSIEQFRQTIRQRVGVLNTDIIFKDYFNIPIVKYRALE